MLVTNVHRSLAYDSVNHILHTKTLCKCDLQCRLLVTSELVESQIYPSIHKLKVQASLKQINDKYFPGMNLNQIPSNFDQMWICEKGLLFLTVCLLGVLRRMNGMSVI